MSGFSAMKHILIIDDAPIIRRYGRLIFESLGFRVSEAETEAEILDRASSDAPDYILIDWIMPGINTLDVIAKLRRAGTVVHVIDSIEAAFDLFR